MKQVIVRYKVKPDRVAENEELVRAVYEELRRTEPPGLRYATFKLDDGIVECGANRAVWLPYVEVAEVDEATRRARRLGASVLLEPREGPAGWRSVVATRAGGEIAFWQPKPPAQPMRWAS